MFLYAENEIAGIDNLYAMELHRPGDSSSADRRASATGHRKLDMRELNRHRTVIISSVDPITWVISGEKRFTFFPCANSGRWYLGLWTSEANCDTGTPKPKEFSSAA
jgi:hypothetical protein